MTRGLTSQMCTKDHLFLSGDDRIVSFARAAAGGLSVAALLLIAAGTCRAQSEAGAAPSAQASKPTANKAGNAKTHKKRTRTRGPLAPEPARIREIQQALAREGFYQGEPTGKWDDASVAAMKQYQEAKGLPATGRLEALSLQKLGLGSPVAGLAPPAPRPSGAADPPPGQTKPPH